MNFKIVATPQFKREVKKLRKKFSSLEQDFASIYKKLKENPVLGQPIGQNCFKIRMAIKSKGKGKRSGARIITYFHVLGDTVYLLSIYDKPSQTNISESAIKNLLDQI